MSRATKKSTRTGRVVSKSPVFGEISLREWFTGCALQSFTSCAEYERTFTAERIAVLCVGMADLIMQELRKPIR